MSINREFSQFASSVNVLANSNFIGIATDGTQVVGIGTDLLFDGATGIVTALLLSGPVTPLGNTYYVSSRGSDLNGGDSITDAFASVSKALSVATVGDTVYIASGVYNETCPLVVPRGVSVRGTGIRETEIRPTSATKTNNVFLLDDLTTVEDLTVSNSFFNTSSDTGYAFSYNTAGVAITTRSPYIQRVTVLNKGSITSSDDPYGYDTADSPPTSFKAGAGAKVDGSLVASNSIEAGMLFNEVTFFTPNNKCIELTNGARVEYLNCFHYFASQAIVGTGGTVGIGSTADARLKVTGINTTPSANQVVKLFEGGTAVAVGTITEYSDPYVSINGIGFGTFTSVGIGTTQDVRFFESDGTTQTGIASRFSYVDYTMFGAEMRSVGCAVEYGSQGVVADGKGVKLRLFAVNFNHVGTGKNITNDPTLSVQANEVTESNDGDVSFVSIDHLGDFRVGDAFFISQETGNVSFAATTYDLETTGNLTVTDGGSNQSVITPTSATIGGLTLSGGSLQSVSGDLTIDPAGANKTIIQGDLSVVGILTAQVFEASAIQQGDTSISITDTGSNGTIIFNTDNAETARFTNTQRMGIGSDAPKVTLDVGGDANVSGTLTATTLSLTNLVIGSSSTITAVDIDITSVSSSDDTLASAKAIKTYVDAQVIAGVGTVALGFAGDSGAGGSVDVFTETFNVVGTANEIDTVGAGLTLTIGLAPNINITGVITASSFTGDVTGTATTATNLANAANITTGTISDDRLPATITSDITGNAATATTSTNIAGGDTGDIPYQSAANTTTFVDATGASPGQVLLWNGSAPQWDNVTAASGSFGGITIKEEGSTVGTANSVTTVNFVSGNITAVATAGANGVATVTLSDTPSFTSSTFTDNIVVGSATTINAQGINAPTGVITASSYQGSGSQLTGITLSQVSGGIGGFTVREETTVVSSAGSITTLSFSSANLTATGSGIGATVTLTDTPTFTSVVVGSAVTINSGGISCGTGIVTATDFNATSDSKLKTNVRVIEDPLEKVLQINGVSFNWIKDNKPSMGVIADNIEEILPELVSNTDPKTVNYNGLIGLLIEVVKEQQTQINSLNERLSRLE